jgi:hypothetical protein
MLRDETNTVSDTLETLLLSEPLPLPRLQITRSPPFIFAVSFIGKNKPFLQIIVSTYFNGVKRLDLPPLTGTDIEYYTSLGFTKETVIVQSKSIGADCEEVAATILSCLMS